MNHPTEEGRRSGGFRFWWIGFGVLLLLSLLPDCFIQHHAHFGFEDYFGFYTVYGFGAGAALVVIAKVMGIFLRRKDTYYDRG